MATLSKIPDFVRLEHQVATLLTQQEIYGWRFDERAAWQLTQTIQEELQKTEKVLQERYPFVQGTEFNPKRDNKTQGYIRGAPFCRLKELNTSSRDHIAWILQTHCGWNPDKLTATGKPIVDETSLKENGSEVAMMFLSQLETTKKLGMLSNGVNAWLRLCTSAKRIHHHCSIGAITHRCTHRNPNLAQVPSDDEFRRLFTASPGYIMVGADLSGIELRMLSHYLSRYDSGRYADILLNGDIHQVNADKIGISRSQVKTVTYAFLYGAGDEKIGHSIDPLLTTKKAKSTGKEIRAAYVDAIPGLQDLLNAVKKASEKGWLKGIDGRKFTITSSHCALNYLLQGSAGVIAKRWMVLADENIKKLGIDKDTHQLAFIHDELQYETKREHESDLCASLVYSAAEAGEYYKLRCPIAAEAVRGDTWADTH